MILRALGPDAPFYRALMPSWSHLPESGAGAALGGGRFNRIGVEARYLAATPEAALAEYQGESPLLPPAMVATYLVTADNVVDYTSGYDASFWSPIWEQAYCNWKGLAFFDRVEPPSWVIGDLVRAAGHAGILYASALNSAATCLVLFPECWGQYRAPVHDPDHRLPRSRESWT